jgi:hypothetical protein
MYSVQCWRRSVFNIQWCKIVFDSAIHAYMWTLHWILQSRMTCRNAFGSPPLAGVRLRHFNVWECISHTVPTVYTSCVRSARVCVFAFVCVRMCVCVYHPQTGNDWAPRRYRKRQAPMFVLDNRISHPRIDHWPYFQLSFCLKTIQFYIIGTKYIFLYNMCTCTNHVIILLKNIYFHIMVR